MEGGADKCSPKGYHPTGVRERTPPDNYRLSHAFETISFLAILNMDCSKKFIIIETTEITVINLYLPCALTLDFLQKWSLCVG